ncbi:dihydrofolate reductase family protein [Streptomyces sp. NPDC089919]|uniref:dihydrofolate reductase family protein n=1 Tax=Streptomyces sp. NPDC089919 TaxID=3155188 RepID=UPI0034288E90
MRKIVFMMGVSLDGYMEGPDREIDWHRVDEELHGHFNRRLAPMGGFLQGRVTHELMADYWPTADRRPDATPIEAEFAALWRDMPKTVYSRTLERPDEWTAELRREVDPAEIAALKAQPGGDLAVGGAVLGAEFRRLDLIDVYEHYVHPVLIGRGRPAFPPLEAPEQPLHLVGTRTFGNGVVMLRYERDRS